MPARRNRLKFSVMVQRKRLVGLEVDVHVEHPLKQTAVVLLAVAQVRSGKRCPNVWRDAIAPGVAHQSTIIGRTRQNRRITAKRRDRVGARVLDRYGLSAGGWSSAKQQGLRE